MYTRTLSNIIPTTFKPGFITVIYGPRRVGKTVLLDQIKALLTDEEQKLSILFNGDTREAIEALSTNSEVRLTNLVKSYNVIFIDEAQKIPNISLALKIIIDSFPDKKIVVTGSSSLQLARGATENLTGRHTTFILYPLSTRELAGDMPSYKVSSLLHEQLVYGAYPYVHTIASYEERKKYLHDITENYLFQDVLSLERLDYPEGFRKVATLLAFQIGREVSLNELARSVSISVKTVSRYIDLLEKSFVIFSLGAYSTNLRKEVSKSKKYYFYDLGIRNTLVSQFQSLEERTDVGELWENFILVERMKKHEYSREIVSKYFWRNYSGTEIDLIEVRDGVMSAYECKWKKDTSRTPRTFREAYNVDVQTINRDNYLQFV